MEECKYKEQPAVTELKELLEHHGESWKTLLDSAIHDAAVRAAEELHDDQKARYQRPPVNNR